MKLLGIAGWSGAGKTTLIVQLLPKLLARGLRVSTLKHAHHDFDIDKPGKDSYLHRKAGATEVLISSPQRWALMHETRHEREPSLQELIAHMSPVDLLLVEGYKRDSHAKLEVFRPAIGKPLMSADDPSFIALLSDSDIPQSSLPRIDLNDTERIAAFILQHCGL